jgi:hypothetical protein
VRDLSKFRASVRLVRALRRSPLSGTVLAAGVGLTPALISNFVHFQTFGPARRIKVLALAESVGVPADRATVRVKQKGVVGGAQ